MEQFDDIARNADDTFMKAYRFHISANRKDDIDDEFLLERDHKYDVFHLEQGPISIVKDGDMVSKCYSKPQLSNDPKLYEMFKEFNEFFKPLGNVLINSPMYQYCCALYF